MFTPQQIDQISFSKSTFGGYNMQQVDEFLEPLTEDYVTLYKENALLKSKMRVLVGKLEEYRKNEAAMKEKVANAQRTCDKMVMEAEAKCAKMLSSANAAAAAQAAQPVAQPVQSVPNNSALIAAETRRGHCQKPRKGGVQLGNLAPDTVGSDVRHPDIAPHALPAFLDVLARCIHAKGLLGVDVGNQ